MWAIGMGGLDEMGVERRALVWAVLLMYEVVLVLGRVYGNRVELGRLLEWDLLRHITSDGSLLGRIAVLAVGTVVLHDPLVVVWALWYGDLIGIVETGRGANHGGRMGPRDCRESGEGGRR